MPPLFFVALTLPGPDASWTPLLDKPVFVECTTAADGQPFCRSSAVFTAPVATLRETLVTMTDHVDRFESIVEVHVLAGDVRHVVMDFPWPLSDRDYVAKYTATDREDGGMVLSWTPTTDPKAPPSADRVRLEQFAGSWTLIPQGDSTRVEYMWHAEYGGSLPDGALTTARKKTGQEALKDLAKAAGGVAYRAP